MKVYLSTLGCKLNESEIESWARRFTADGHELVADARDADICVLNTCTVTHTAAHKSRQMARQLARANPKARLVLSGCYADIAPAEAKGLPNVALVVPNVDKDRLVALAGDMWNDAVFQSTENGCRMPEAASGDVAGVAGERETLRGDGARVAETCHRHVSTGSVLRTRAFVKIEDGCNMSCTYCIIPLARGKERSRSREEIVSEVQSLVTAGYQEIILTGVQISSYRTGAGEDRLVLRDLVAAILAETNVPRLRLTSIAPWDLDASLLDLWSDSRICRHLHLSLQSGSDTVLRRMRRPYSTEQFARAAALAREKIPALGLTTDVIVGFPGESEVEFEQSLRFVEEMQFSRVHVFPYSARAGTIAAALPLQVADAVKEPRRQRMQAIADASVRAFAARFVGQTMPVLWELREKAAELTWSGYTDNYVRVVAASDADLHNRIAPAKIDGVAGEGAIGKVVL